MQTNRLNFPPDIPIKLLTTINGIKFTAREIDIIACLLSGRSSKAIGAFLSIEEKTVETHKYNIMRKLECNSRENIRDFIERSDKFSEIKKHYVNLLVEATFKQRLQEISARNSGNTPVCLLIYEPDYAYTLPFLHKLEEHLKVVGVKLFVETRKHYKSITQLIHKLESQAVDFIIYPLSEVLITQLQDCDSKAKLEIAQLIQRAKQHPGSVIFLLEKQDTSKISQEISEVGYVDCQELENHYFIVLEILKRVLPNFDLEKIIAEFKRQYQMIVGSFENLPSQMWSEVTHALEKGNLYSFKNLWQRGNIWLLISGMLCVSALGILFLTSNDLTSKKTSQLTLNPANKVQERLFIRSDLPLPVENALLKRPELMTQIEEKLKAQQGIQTVSLVGVVGMGGVGKTTLARQFGRSQNASIVWELNAETKESLINSFKDLAYALADTQEKKDELNFIQNIQDIKEKEKQVLFFVKRQLKAKENWLLIYDNIEKFSKIRQYLPQDPQVWGAGKVIITTRDTNLRNTNYIKSENVISVEALSPTEALILFSKILYNCDPQMLTVKQKQEFVNFLKNIPPFPLDISTAAYYIKNTEITFEEYIERIKKYSEAFYKEQENLLKESSDYTKTRYGIIASSLTKIINLKPEFIEPLFLICLLNSQNIPKELLEMPNFNINDFLYDLKRHGLVSNQLFTIGTKAQSTVSIHRSVQFFILNYLNEKLNYEAKEKILNNILILIRSWYNKYIIGRSYKILSILTLHLHSIIKNMNNISVSKEIKSKLESELFILIGHAHYRSSNNLVLAKKYFKKIMNNEYIENNTLIYMLHKLGAICIDLGNFDEGIQYCNKSIELYKKKKSSELTLEENLKMIGVAYIEKDNFMEAKNYFEMALKELSKRDDTQPRKIEVESDIYEQLAALYSKKYITRKEAYKAKEYAIKSLEILGALHILHKKAPQKEKKIPCCIARHRWRLGEVYSKLGQYEKANEQGYYETDYIIKHGLDNCSHTLLQAQVLLGLGESSLRKDELIQAEQELSNSIIIFEKLVGDFATLPAKVFRAEARIRLGKLKEGYNDCVDIMTMKENEKNKRNNNYIKLMNLTSFYHAAVIKYKEGDLKKSERHFYEFFKKAKMFCLSFFDEEIFNKLVSQGLFIEVPYKDNSLEYRTAEYFSKSSEIFSTIYGTSHPFIRDYILKNYRG